MKKKILGQIILILTIPTLCSLLPFISDKKDIKIFNFLNIADNVSLSIFCFMLILEIAAYIFISIIFKAIEWSFD